MNKGFFDPSSLIEDESSEENKEDVASTSDAFEQAEFQVEDFQAEDFERESLTALGEPSLADDAHEAVSELFDEVTADEPAMNSDAEAGFDFAVSPEELVEDSTALDDPFSFANNMEESVAQPAEEYDAYEQGVGGPFADSTDFVGENTETTHFVQVEESSIPRSVSQVTLAKNMFSLVLCEYPFATLVENILKNTMEAVDATVGSIIELDYGRNDFFFRSAIGGAADKLESVRIPKDKGLVGYVAESKNSLMLKDAQNDQQHLKSISLMVGFEAKSCIVVPIFIANKLYGIIELFNKKGNGLFNQDDLEITEQSAKWAAKVLEVRFLTAMLANKK